MVENIKSLTFIVPCLNESDNISLFMDGVLEMRKANPSIKFRVMFVDDGSVDDSRKIIINLNKKFIDVDYVFLTRNFGAHLALLAGLDSAETDMAVFMPCDQVSDPSLINQMIKYADEGAEVVIGKRKNRKTKFINRFFSWAFYYLFNLVGDVRLPPGGSDFFLITKRPMEFLRKNKEYNANLFMLLLWPGFNYRTLECEIHPREKGESKWTFSKRLRLAIDSFFGFSMFPLRVLTGLGLFLSFTSFMFLVYTIGNYFYLGTPVPGVPTIVCAIAFGFGCVFLALGIIAEYLFRNLDFSRKRPLYVIEDQSGVKK